MGTWDYHRVMLLGTIRAMEDLERQGKKVRALRRVGGADAAREGRGSIHRKEGAAFPPLRERLSQTRVQELMGRRAERQMVLVIDRDRTDP